MSVVKVIMSESDIHAACKAWAVTMILSEGIATRSYIGTNHKPALGEEMTSMTVYVDTTKPTA